MFFFFNYLYSKDHSPGGQPEKYFTQFAQTSTKVTACFGGRRAPENTSGDDIDHKDHHLFNSYDTMWKSKTRMNSW